MISITVKNDQITKDISKTFDYNFDGTSYFQPKEISSFDRMMYATDFSIGLIVGPSGTGKSILLKEFGEEDVIEWDESKAICSHFESAKEAQEKLSAVGLNTIPSWLKPYHVLSVGEKFRADLSRKLKSNSVIDEYTSVVDRNTAKSSCVAIRRYIDKHGLKNVVFASCHYDIIPWLNPDWVYNTIDGSMTTRGLERRPTISLEVLPCTVEAWSMFRQHHYLSGDINKSSRCWITIWDGQPVGFSANLALPSAHLKNAWRGHRTVILPEYQGMGFGSRMSEAVAEIFLSEGKRYFTKTSHPRLGEYRESSPKWRSTSHNKKLRMDYVNSNDHKFSEKLKDIHKDRLTYNHEYVGENSI